VQKLAQLLFFTCSLSAAMAQSDRAQTASYPEKNPLFTVEIPNGWQLQRENGAVKLVAQANAVCLLQHVDNVKDEETAQTALPELMQLEGHQFNLNSLVISGKPKVVKLGDFKGFAAIGRGTDKGGGETLWQTMLFAPKEGDYYLVTCFWTKNEEDKTTVDRTSIFTSLKSLDPFYVSR